MLIRKNSLVSFGFVYIREFSLSGATIGYIWNRFYLSEVARVCPTQMQKNYIVPPIV
jgi:hypothetical protein